MTYIFIELGETGAEVEDGCQVSTYIARDFNFGGIWTLEKNKLNEHPLHTWIQACYTQCTYLSV